MKRPHRSSLCFWSRVFRLILFLAVILLSKESVSQTTRIRGSVSDASVNEPLPFVNIAFMGTTIGTISDFDGNFFLETRNPGVGVENIFRVVRFDALWRLTHLDNPFIERFGLRTGLQIIF